MDERRALERRVAELEAELRRWREAAENLGQLAENVEQVFWMEDPARAELLYVNRAYERIYGRSVESLRDDFTTFLEAVHPEDRARVEGAVSRQAAGKRTVEEYRVVRPDGSVRWVVDRSFPIRDETGRVVRVCGVVADITERREEARVRDRLFAAIEAADDGIAILGPEATYTYLNRAHLRIYGYDDESELLGQGWQVLYGVSQRREFEEKHLPELRRSGAWRGEAIGRRRDGSLFEQEVSLRSLEGGGLVCIVRDVTDRNRSSRVVQRAQKLESLGLLAGGIAHDFNNLLTGVLGNADLALHALPEEASGLRSHLDHIVVAAERAAELCEQLLSYAGRGSVRPTRVDLGELLCEMDPLLGISVGHQAVLRYELAQGLPPVEGDPGQLRQVIMNLVMNAAEASEGADAVVTMRTSLERVEAHEPGSAAGATARPREGGAPPAGRYVVIEVEDQGAGMEPEVLERIFDPFFTTKLTGRGLGLAAVIGIVHAHGGTIQVRSVPARGTRMRVLLPVTRDEARAPETPGAAAPAADLHWRARGTVLVVDDEVIALGVARAALERRGLDVVVARSGREGLERHAELGDRIVLVLLDLTMPGMDLESVLAGLTESGATAPVLVTSGWDEASVRERVRRLPVAGVVRKPYSIARLDEAVHAALHPDRVTPRG